MKTDAPPKIDLRAIKSWIDPRSFERGERYFRDGAIFDARRQGKTIKARCEGSQGGPYRVEVTIGPKGIEAAECSCPVGDGGHCKHAAALLLTWRARPEEFVEVESTDAALGRRSKAELIALVKQMLRRDPDLETLLELPTPTKKGAKEPPPSPDLFRRQAERALREVDPYDEWGGGPTVEEAVRPIVDIGDGYLAVNNEPAAAAVYEGVLAALADHEALGDDAIEIIDHCAEALGKALSRLKADTSRREAILRALFDIAESAGEVDVIGLIREQATEAERATVVGWAEEALDQAGEYAKQSAAQVLLDLHGEEIDDETYLKICRDAGQIEPQIDRLLQLGRTAEAARAWDKAKDYRFLGLADRFVEHGQADLAEAKVRAWANSHYNDTAALEWLRKRARQRGDRAAARELTEQLFDRYPSLALFKELKTLAGKAGWGELRPTLLSRLEKRRRDDVLVEIHLDEGDIDRAIAVVRAAEKTSSYGSSHKREVAKAAESTRPEFALEVYRKEAERLINNRSRGDYQAACQDLVRVRNLYRKLGRQDEWEYEIGVLRERYRGLPALKDEMARAKL